MPSKVFCFFKLFNSVKDKTESSDFARLEIQSLFGPVEEVHNVFDIVRKSPLTHFTVPEVRIQDMLTHELPYGRIQGYSLWTDRVYNLDSIIRRLGYTREIFVVVEDSNPLDLLSKIFPDYALDKNTQFFQSSGHTLFRFITHQYFLEKSEYISKLSRNESEVDKNTDALFSHLTRNIFRIPASENMGVGKRLEDYFASRTEPSLYLTHYMHPYKGKFHPKMARALINYIYPGTTGVVLDNFAGSGTALVEASLMGLDSKGVEINPLSTLMTKVKCHCLGLDSSLLKQQIEKYLAMVDNEVQAGSTPSQLSLLAKSKESGDHHPAKADIPERVLTGLRNKDDVRKIQIAQSILQKVKKTDIREFLLLALSGTISDLYRRTVSRDFEEVLRGRLQNLYLRVYLFHQLNKTLKIKLGKCEAYTGDTRHMDMIGEEDVHAIINSPPYSTALDYVKNDEPQLYILGLTASIYELERNMIGHPKVRYDKQEVNNEMTSDKADIKHFSPYGAELLSMLSNGRVDVALRTYKFWSDMIATTKEMYRVLKSGSKCAVIIGNNNYSLDGKPIEVQNDRAIREIAENVGFQTNIVIKRTLEKTMSGSIRYESVVVLQK